MQTSLPSRSAPWTVTLSVTGALVLFLLGKPDFSQAASGTETAAFLDIPVGAGPAALGSAYTALATDAYAPVWNPAGMTSADMTEVSGQHLAYLQSVDYEYVSALHRLGENGDQAIGAAIQYLGTGDIDSTNLAGDSIGTYSSHFAAYSLSYARQFPGKLSVGVTGKVINAKIGDFSADAYAADIGLLYPIDKQLTLGAAVSNVGTTLNFISDGEQLPLQGRLGFAYQPVSQFTLSVEGTCDRSEQLAGHVGAEWRPLELIALRAGYRTDNTQEQDGTVGVTAGLGLYFWGQEFAYAWVPYGELGDTQYFSIVLHFGGAEQHRRNLIHYQSINRPRYADSSPYINEGRPGSDEGQQILELLEQGDEKPLAENVR